MTDLINMTDADLIAARDHAREMAHSAPKNLSMNADGSATLQHSTAWARWSREWARLADEVDRRAAIISGQPPLERD